MSIRVDGLFKQSKERAFSDPLPGALNELYEVFKKWEEDLVERGFPREFVTLTLYLLEMSRLRASMLAMVTLPPPCSCYLGDGFVHKKSCAYTEWALAGLDSIRRKIDSMNADSVKIFDGLHEKLRERLEREAREEEK